MSTPAQNRPVLRGVILDAAVTLARTKSYRELTPIEISQAAKCSKASIFWHFKTLDALRNAIVQRAVDENVMPVLAEAIAVKHPLTHDIAPSVRRAALLSLSKPPQ